MQTENYGDCKATKNRDYSAITNQIVRLKDGKKFWLWPDGHRRKN